MKIPQDLEIFIKEIASESGLKKFVLCGGNVIDFFLKHRFNYSDVDLFIEARTKKEKTAIIKSLKENGFNTSREREYLICKTKKVYLFKAKKGKILLDIAMCPPPAEKIPGPFKAESMYCVYPKMICIDKDNSIKAIKEKIFICKKNRGFNHEEPSLLLGRFLLLCSKYDASLFSPKEHRDFIKTFNSKKNIKGSKEIIEKNKSSLLSKILRAILNSKNKKKFIKEILDSKILLDFMDELEKPLRNIHKNLYVKKIENKKELIKEILKNCEKKDKKIITKRINNLK